MALPLDVKDLARSGARIRKDREQPVVLAVLVEVDAPDALIDGLREQLRPQTAAARVTVDVVQPGTTPPAIAADALIALAGSGSAELRDAVAAARGGLVPAVVLALAGPEIVTELADSLGQPLADLIVGSEAGDLVGDRLARWLAEELASKRMPLAHNFAFMRRAVAEEAVQSTAWQNALVGTVAIIPGADMPIMTANQGKMLLQIAAAYGEPLGAERMKELAAVVGGGFAFRAIARQVLGAVPVLGWAVKGGIGYAGTVAMGKAAIAYFEQGADLTQVVRHLQEGAARAAERLPHREPHVSSTRMGVSVQQELPGVDPEPARRPRD